MGRRFEPSPGYHLKNISELAGLSKCFEETSVMKKITDETKTLIQKDRETIGLSIYQLADKYKISKSSVSSIVKNCDDSMVKRASPSRTVAKETTPVRRPNLSKGDLGEAARQTICARLMFQGITVFRPMTEDTPTDLLILKRNGKVLKCQCKYIFPRGNGSHLMPLFTIRKNGPGSKAFQHFYSNEEVDIFLGYCLENDTVYVVPFEEAKGRKALYFWVLREPVGSNSKERFDFKRYASYYGILK